MVLKDNSNRLALFPKAPTKMCVDRNKMAIRQLKEGIITGNYKGKEAHF